METNYEWIISALDCRVKNGTLENIVNVVHWRLRAFNGVYTTETYGCTTMPEPSETDFTQYENLTKEQVVQWLINILELEKIKSNLNENLYLLEHPFKINLPLPF